MFNRLCENRVDNHWHCSFGCCIIIVVIVEEEEPCTPTWDGDLLMVLNENNGPRTLSLIIFVIFSYFDKHFQRGLTYTCNIWRHK